MIKKTVPLAGIRDLDLDSITIRAVNGDDMLDASARCVAPDGSAIDPNLFHMMLRQQLVAQAIVDHVPRHGEKAGQTVVTVEGSCQDSITWNSRTREFVGEVWDYVNAVSNQEREDFRKALMGETKSTDGSPDAVRAE